MLDQHANKSKEQLADKLTTMEWSMLKAAADVMKNSFVVGTFRVGAAVLGADAHIYTGCNVESCISGLGICAERCAIDHSVVHGSRRIKELALVLDSNTPCEAVPCGACLQYIHDFAENGEVRIVSAKARKGRIALESVQIHRLSEFLPLPFGK